MSNTSDMSLEQVKDAIALQLSVSDVVRNMTGSRVSSDFMLELLLNYRKVDPKAVFGAQNMVDFLTSLHVGQLEFLIMMDLCEYKVYNFVLISRAHQLGILTDSDITRNFRHTTNHFDFYQLTKLVQDRGIKLNRF